MWRGAFTLAAADVEFEWARDAGEKDNNIPSVISHLFCTAA